MATLDYTSLRKRYADGIDCPLDFSFPSSVIDRIALENKERVAIHWVQHDFKIERKISYAELSDLSHRAAIVFDGLGLKKGDRVMIQLGRRVEWWVTLFGLMRIGAVPIPGTSLLVGKGESSPARDILGSRGPDRVPRYLPRPSPGQI